MSSPIRIFLMLVLTISAAGCVKPGRVKLPPVVEGWKGSSVAKNAYIVQKNDTLYSISWAFGLDYRDLAAINDLQAPYAIRVGQKLYIAQQSNHPKIKIKTESKKRKKKKKRVVTKTLKGWNWPTSGKVISTFSNKLGGNRGIDIKGIYGQSIKASNAGRVVYSGSGIRSYGKLIIINHNDDYLSAYAYNQHILVKEGRSIKAGQQIATMGTNNEGQAVVHFEIRRFGKPVNPLSYLPKK